MNGEETTFYMEGMSVEDGITYRLVVNGVPSNEVTIHVYHESGECTCGCGMPGCTCGLDCPMMSDTCPECGGMNGMHEPGCSMGDGGEKPDDLQMMSGAFSISPRSVSPQIIEEESEDDQQSVQETLDSDDDQQEEDNQESSDVFTSGDENVIIDDALEEVDETQDEVVELIDEE